MTRGKNQKNKNVKKCDARMRSRTVCKHVSREKATLTNCVSSVLFYEIVRNNWEKFWKIIFKESVGTLSEGVVIIVRK